MGACEFSDISFGKDAQDAYGKAVSEALYEYGHNSYNGTISTTSGFVEVKLPRSMSVDELREMTFELRDSTDFLTLPVRRKFADEWERKRYQRRRKLRQKWDRLTAQERAEVSRAANSIQKWESCVCVQLPKSRETEWRKAHPSYKGKKGNVYYFFGIAAE